MFELRGEAVGAGFHLFEFRLLQVGVSLLMAPLERGNVAPDRAAHSEGALDPVPFDEDADVSLSTTEQLGCLVLCDFLIKVHKYWIISKLSKLFHLVRSRDTGSHLEARKDPNSLSFPHHASLLRTKNLHPLLIQPCRRI